MEAGSDLGQAASSFLGVERKHFLGYCLRDTPGTEGSMVLGGEAFRER